MSYRASALALSAITMIAAACSEGATPTAPVAISPRAPALAINPAVACTGATMPVVECEALVALYNGTNGPGWVKKSGWGTDPNPCAWEGITCTAGDNGSVRVIDIFLASLSGPIPSELGNLSSLDRLSLWANHLTGPIPASLANLTSLDTLELTSNELTGPIPAWLGNLTNLRSLHLTQNQFSGSIPASLGNLTNLVALSIGQNQLTGSIPASLGNLTALRALHLNNNELSGALPDALGNLINVENVSFYRNQLTGSIPASFANLDKLEVFSLGFNDLTGPVPEVVMQMAELQIIHFQENEFSGVLPLALVVYLEGLSWCQFDDGNPDLIIPDAQSYRDADQDGDGLICFKELTPAEDISEDTIDEIEELVPTVLNQGQANALQTKIDNAMEKAEKGQFNAAINQMQSFLSQLANMVANGTLTPDQAAPFIAQAEALIAIWTGEL